MERKSNTAFWPDMKLATSLVLAWIVFVSQLASAFADVPVEPVRMQTADNSVAVIMVEPTFDDGRATENYWQILDELDSLAGTDEAPLPPLALVGPSSRHAHRLIDFDHHAKSGVH